ncbi:hypothetical protein Tco_1448013 [Tanacetum coccineum]
MCWFKEKEYVCLRFEFQSKGGEESEDNGVCVCEIQIVIRKKVNSRYVVENVLMGCRGAYVGNEGDKREGLCEEEFRLKECFEDKKYEGDDV